MSRASLPHNIVRYFKKRTRVLTAVIVVLVFLVLLLGIYFLSLNQPTAQFPVERDFVIQEGSNATEVIEHLKRKGFVRSTKYSSYLFKKEFSDDLIQAGSYRFPEPMTTREIFAAITEGTHSSPPITITLPEGFKAESIYKYIPKKYSSDDSDIDLKSYEGYLFPDTYFLSEDDTVADIVTLARTNFDKKIAEYDEEIAASGLSKEEVIIFASIIEREASDEESLRMVAGILHNRLAIDMPLQVDAVFAYLLGRGSAHLTKKDLAMDSPYNTYKNIGLPPTPISNPGLLAIDAVLNPTESDYLFFLTGHDGNFYYAETFEQHKQNKWRYYQ